MEEGKTSWGYSPSRGLEITKGKLFKIAYPHFPNAICVTGSDVGSFDSTINTNWLGSMNHFYKLPQYLEWLIS